MKKPSASSGASRTTRSHSQAPSVAASGSHTSFHRAASKPDRVGPAPAPSTLAMVHEDGRCELSMDDSYVVDYDFQATPVMGGQAPPRFVAGHAFFNYQLYGGLRKGGSVSLLAAAYRGYALAAVVSGYAYACVMYLLLRLPEQALFLDGTTRLKNVLSLQWTVVLVVGVVSDSIAPRGLKRKPYVLAGWAIAALLWLALFVLFQSSSSPPPQHATVTLLVLAFLAQVVATTAMDIRVIELSQQEEQQLRGRLVGTYEAARIAAQLVLHSLVAVIVKPDAKSLDIHLPFRVDFVFLHLAVVCALPLYWLVRNAHEEPTPASTLPPLPLLTSAQATPLPSSMATTTPAKPSRAPSTSQLRAVLRTFWLSAQQRVVWQLMLFNGVLFFFGLFELADARRAVQFWSHDSSVARLVRNCVGDAAFVVALLLWRSYGVNANWRTLTVAAIVGWSGVNFVLSTLVVFGVVRAPWIAALSWVLKSPFRVLTLLAAFVPTIEIAPAGTEGTTYALLSCFQNIVKLLAAELARVIVAAWPTVQYSTKALQASSTATQNAQFYALLATTGWVLVAVAGVFLLPRQKLDAQQMRAYGGYSTLPLVVLLLGFGVAFPYVFYLQIARL